MSTPDTPPLASDRPRPTARVGRVADALWKGYAVLGGLGVLTLLVVVVIDVSLRYLANSGIPGGNDLVSSWFMTTIAFAGIALAQAKDGRIQVDFLMDATPGRLRQVVDVLVLLAVGAVGALFAWYGWQEAMDQMEAGEYTPIGERPIWPFRFLVPLGFAGFTLACLLSAIEVVRRGPSEIPLSEVEYERAALAAADTDRRSTPSDARSNR